MQKFLAQAFSKQNRFYKFPCYSYSNIQDKVIDVLRLEFDEKGYFINFPGRTMPVSLDMSVSEAQLDLFQKYRFGEIHFFNKDGDSYAVSTPLQLIIQDDFFINLENQFFYVVNTLNSHNIALGVQTIHDTNFDYKKIKDFCQVGGHTMQQQNVLQEFFGEFAEQLKKDSKELIDRQHLDLVIKSVLNKMSIKNSFRVQQLEKLIQVVEKRLSKEERDKKNLDETLVQKKMRKFFKRFFGVVLAQIGLVQYGTYVFISWDFMEPITCLLGISDAIIAYGYWLFVNKKYGYDTLAERKIAKLQKSKYYTREIDESDIFAKKDILDYLYRLKYYHSNSLFEVLNIFVNEKDLEKFTQKNSHLSADK
ncbi:hypothetical protein ABPG72_019163 [Tetrahymena utriculariae]